MGIRENIIKLRKIFNVTQAELAEIAGVFARSGIPMGRWIF